ncbi:xanthine dehydrogenase family protein subunit M [Thioclava sp. BHET1]|nr:xanthine dehydrogenase family protein subunit M [Thioclava sp. BHET1]
MGDSAVASYHRPRSLPEALRIASSGDVVPAAGCTDLFPAIQAQSLRGAILDLTAITELSGITEGVEGWRIGAATRWSALLRADLPPAFDGLKAAAREVGSVQIQNSGTIGGNLCNASPAADGVPALLTLNAEVELASERGVRRLALTEFITGVRKTARAADEILTAVIVPPLAGQGAFLKLGARKHLVISIVMVAGRLVLDGGVVREAALAVGACSPVAQRLPALEAALIGQRVAALAGLARADLIAPQLAPIADIRADAAYRATAAQELLRRLLAGFEAERTAA